MAIARVLGIDGIVGWQSLLGENHGCGSHRRAQHRSKKKRPHRKFSVQQLLLRTSVITAPRNLSSACRSPKLAAFALKSVRWTDLTGYAGRASLLERNL